MITYEIKGGRITIDDREYRGYTWIDANIEDYHINKDILSAFLDSLVAHIAYVREAGVKLGVAHQQLVQHDLSKFSLEELPYYARNFSGDKADPDGFARAWLHHLQTNEHHWQHWIFPDGFTPKGSSVENGVIEMPYHYVLEMIADWMGASRAYTGSYDMTDWLFNNLPKIRVHSATKEYLRQTLDAMGYADVVNGGW